MISIESVLNWVMSAGIGTITSLGVVWFFRTWISERIKNQIKHEYDEKLETHKAQLKGASDVEIEKLKSGLSTAAAERNVRFSSLHQKRADVIAEVYALLKNLVRALGAYTAVFEPAGAPSKEERAATAQEAFNLFIDFYEVKKIFLPLKSAKLVDGFSAEAKKIFLEFLYSVDFKQRAKADTEDSTKKWLEIWGRVEKLSRSALDELEAEFRALLGDEPPPPVQPKPGR